MAQWYNRLLSENEPATDRPLAPLLLPRKAWSDEYCRREFWRLRSLGQISCRRSSVPMRRSASLRTTANLAFMSSGLTEISGATSEIQPSQLVRACYVDLLKDGRQVSMKDLATAYAKLTTGQLNRLSDSEKAAVGSLLRQFFGSPDNQVMESIITGIDPDRNPKVETVDFYLSRPFPLYPDVLRFEWNLDEAIATEAPRVILSGEVGVLRSAFQDGATPISELPSVRTWSHAMHEGKQVNAVQTAEALLNLAIKYSPPDQTRFGYPIFVYTLDGKSGLKKLGRSPFLFLMLVPLSSSANWTIAPNLYDNLAVQLIPW